VSDTASPDLETQWRKITLFYRLITLLPDSLKHRWLLAPCNFAFMILNLFFKVPRQ